MHDFNSYSEEETIEFAKKYASTLEKNKIILLCGDLGAGKTKFVQGVLRFFDLENEISSPTFTIVNEYVNDNISIYHFDLYRLEDIDEFYAIGGEEYFSKGICIFEWGELIEPLLKDYNYTKIIFSKDNENPNYRNLKIEEIKNS